MARQILKRIHVNQHNVKANVKNGNEELPVFTIKTSKQNVLARRVKVTGEMELVYSPEKPLSCGARVWLETKDTVHFQSETDLGLNGVV